MKKIFLFVGIVLFLNVIAFLFLFVSLVYATGVFNGIISFYLLPQIILGTFIVELIYAFNLLSRPGMKEVGKGMLIAIVLTLFLFYLLIQ